MKVGVIMGGISSEREISLKSGNSIVEKIDKNKYEAGPIVIDNKEDIVKVKGIYLLISSSWKIWRGWNSSISTSNFRYTLF